MIFIYVTVQFTHSHSGSLGDIFGYIQILSGTYQSDRPINTTGVDKFHLKADCIMASIVNGCREPSLYSYALFPPLGQKIFKEPRIKLFKKDK